MLVSIVLGAILGGLGYVAHHAIADETSTGDKLRILYSNRFTFTDDRLPLVTVEIMGKQTQIDISGQGGVIALPNGEGSTEVAAGSRWTLTVDNPTAPKITDWTIVAQHHPAKKDEIQASIAYWSSLGFSPKSFETGTIFAVNGDVMDNREIRIGISPVPTGQGKTTARRLAKEYQVETKVHEELIRPPQGVIVARSENVVLRNPSVIWFSPNGNTPLTVHNVIVGGGGSQLKTKREDRHYFGRIYVTLDRNGQLTVVNAVSADVLLAGLVPSEMFPTAPRDALFAQAIAARTELLQKIGTRHLSDPFLLCSTQHCQVYSGAGKEHPRTTQVVRKTRGLVLVRNNGGLVDARYSAACGGHGEHKHNIWGGHTDSSLHGSLDTLDSQAQLRQFKTGVSNANLRAFLDLPANATACGRSKYSKGRYRWSKRIDATALTQRVAAAYPQIGEVEKLEPLTRGVSGRIRSLRIIGSNQAIIVDGDLHIRRLLGGLRSSLFMVRYVGPQSDRKTFVFEGAGFGHGVGMCQLGAIGYAQTGVSYGRILQHYYADSQLRRLY